MGLTAILDGHTKELLKQNNDLYEQRMTICRKCPLFKVTVVGPVCNSNLYLNIKTGDVSKTQKDGYKKGCGCRLNAKTRLSYTKCPLNKW